MQKADGFTIGLACPLKLIAATPSG